MEGARFRMLETIREYARERLEAHGETERVERRYADYYLALSEEIEPELYGSRQNHAFGRIEVEYANFRGVLEWLYGRGEVEAGLRLSGALGWFWFRKARFTEEQYWLNCFRTLAEKTKDSFLLCQTVSDMGNFHAWAGKLKEAEPWYLKSLRLAREINDTYSILENINALADGYLGLGQLDKAKNLLSEGLHIALNFGTKGFIGWYIGGFYNIAKITGDNIRAMRLGAFSESILNPGNRYDPRIGKVLHLDEETAEAEWEAGQSMTPEQAVDYALTP